MGFYTDDELRILGFARLGSNVLISRKASIYNPGRIAIASNVRIDDFCVLSAGEGGIDIGNFVHIAVYCSIMGFGTISFKDFSGLSSRVSVYSSNDDYSGDTLTNPTVPDRFKNVQVGNVYLGKHVIIGAGSVVLPGVSLHEGAAVGALSLVNRDCEAFGIYSGVPARRVRERKQDLLEKEKALLAELSRGSGNALSPLR